MFMKNSQLIQKFAKGKADDDKKQNQKSAVIYTRVSTKEQADTNQSLETQKKYCLQYALKHELNVLGFFGGAYESAKTDAEDIRLRRILLANCLFSANQNSCRPLISKF